MGIFHSIYRRDFSRKCSTNLCQRSVYITWITREDYIRQRPKICNSILENLFSGTKSLSSNINSISSTDRWSDKETEPDIKTVSTTLCQLHTEQLVRVIISCTVCI